MTKQSFMAIIADLNIGKITTFSINYKEYDLPDDPIKTIKVEEINDKHDSVIEVVKENNEESNTL